MNYAVRGRPRWTGRGREFWLHVNHLEQELASHSSVFAKKTPWTETKHTICYSKNTDKQNQLSSSGVVMQAFQCFQGGSDLNQMVLNHDLKFFKSDFFYNLNFKKT